jgi:hypothetical protein
MTSARSRSANLWQVEWVGSNLTSKIHIIVTADFNTMDDFDSLLSVMTAVKAESPSRILGSLERHCHSPISPEWPNLNVLLQSDSKFRFSVFNEESHFHDRNLSFGPQN